MKHGKAQRKALSFWVLVLLKNRELVKCVQRAKEKVLWLNCGSTVSGQDLKDPTHWSFRNVYINMWHNGHQWNNGYQWISMIWSDTKVLNMWLWILDPQWSQWSQWSSCCLLSKGGNIWQMLCFTNFNSRAVSCKVSVNHSESLRKQFVHVCSTDFGSHTGAKHYEHRNTHSALRLRSSEIARSTRMQICSRWSYASCSDCDDIFWNESWGGAIQKKYCDWR